MLLSIHCSLLLQLFVCCLFLIFVLLCSTWCLFYFCNNFAEEKSWLLYFDYLLAIMYVVASVLCLFLAVPLVGL